MVEADPQQTFNVHEAKTQFSRLIDRAHAGEEIIVAKAGVPCAKLVSFAPAVPRKLKSGGLTVTGPIDWDAFDQPLSEDELRYIDDRPAGQRG